VSPELVRQRNLRVRDTGNVESVVFNEKIFESTKSVTITWFGKNNMKTQESEFLVASEPMPFEMIVGADFVESFGAKAFFEEHGAEAALVLQNVGNKSRTLNRA
jgi:hypothetical protein